MPPAFREMMKGSYPFRLDLGVSWRQLTLWVGQSAPLLGFLAEDRDTTEEVENAAEIGIEHTLGLSEGGHRRPDGPARRRPPPHLAQQDDQDDQDDE